MLNNMTIKNKRTSLRVMKIKCNTTKNSIHKSSIIDKVNDDGMSRQSRSRNLKIVLEIGGSGADFLAMVEILDGGVVSKDGKVYKELIDKFEIECNVTIKR